MGKLLFLIMLILLATPASSQQDADVESWRLVAAIGRGDIMHSETREGIILVDTGNATWLYRADTLEDIARLDLRSAHLSDDGQYVYGYKYSEPFNQAMNEHRPPLLNVIYDIVANEEVELQPESDSLIRPSYDGSYFIGRDGEGRLLVWSSPNFSEPLLIPDALILPDDQITWSPIANRLGVYDAQYGLLHVWTVGQSVTDFTLDVGRIRAFEWSVDGTKLIVNAGSPPILTVLDALTGIERFHISLDRCFDPQCAYYYAWRPDGAHLAIAILYSRDKNDQSFAVYDANNGTNLHQMNFTSRSLQFPYQPFRYSKDSRWLLVNEQRYGAESFDTISGPLPHEILVNQLPPELTKLHRSFSLSSPIFNDTGDWLAVRTLAGELIIVNTHTGQVEYEVDGIAGFAWQPDSPRIAILLDSKEISDWQSLSKHMQYWDVAEKRLIHEISYEMSITRFTWQGSQLITLHNAMSDNPNSSEIELAWDADLGEFVDSIQKPCENAPSWWDYVPGFLELSSRSLLAENTCNYEDDNNCHIVVEVVCGAGAGDILLKIEVDQRNQAGLVWRPDGEQIAILDRRGYFVVDLEGNISPLPGFPVWSPDSSKMLLRGSFDGGMIVVNSISGETLLTLPDVGGASWSPGGSWISAARYGEGDRVFILDGESGEETLRIWSNPIFGGLEWGNDKVLLSHRSMFNEYELNIWRWE